jgi:HSP20 family protein
MRYLYSPANLLNLLDLENYFQDVVDRGLPRRSNTSNYPRVNAWLKDDAVILTAELPGADPGKIDISIQDSKLVISGSIPCRERKDGETYLRSERRTGNFHRELDMPFRISRDGVTAEFKNGLLRLTASRAEDDKPKKIAVTAG